MPKLFSPKDLAPVIRIDPQSVRRILRETRSVVTVNRQRVLLKKKRVNGRWYITEESYNRVVALMND